MRDGMWGEMGGGVLWGCGGGESGGRRPEARRGWAVLTDRLKAAGGGVQARRVARAWLAAKSKRSYGLRLKSDTMEKKLFIRPSMPSRLCLASTENCSTVVNLGKRVGVGGDGCKGCCGMGGVWAVRRGR